MLYCHDGTHTVVVHVPPKTLTNYATGNGSGATAASLSAGAAPTLNRLGAKGCLIGIGGWQWSTAVVCSAWMRGPVGESAQVLKNKSRPFCIQVGVLRHIDADLDHAIYAAGALVDCNVSLAVANVIAAHLPTHRHCLATLARGAEGQAEASAVSSRTSSWAGGRGRNAGSGGAGGDVASRGGVLDAYGLVPLSIEGPEWRHGGPLDLSMFPPRYL